MVNPSLPFPLREIHLSLLLVPRLSVEDFINYCKTGDTEAVAEALHHCPALVDAEDNVSTS